ncbi:acetyltransferase, ribosomal protein N-acetylase [Galbibacter orientalis DSM 19592]|uniref:Acetyltransferase, ribosomal protein N-acetylase n=1 Tax=Galbibacter orientalis DSM 19592 TaxID=926559 RepID=I3C646_9FLAO|nr:GNAT family N-acetyltransferase [Galbibacter orientalis]EIJ39089.1 acetyltransferase, ribosomal protein N-acetylase [Galbibacter orientalis DSM 19592]
MNRTEISTDRLKLRLIELTDLESIHNLHSLPETDEYNALGIPENIEETKSIIEPWITNNQLPEIKNYTFAIDLISNGDFIGLFGLKLGSTKYKRAEVWYKIHSNYWKKGYASESLKAVINFGFKTLKLHRIEAGCAINNIGSIKVLEKVGMIREGHRRQVLPLKSGWSDNYEYAILESEVGCKQ